MVKLLSSSAKYFSYFLLILQAEKQARRNQLMKDMAQLRLQAEVSQLEGSLQSSQLPSLPPYLVPDATVLCENLIVIKTLVQCGRFIVIIPIAGTLYLKSTHFLLFTVSQYNLD